jgi:hypothetical protein
MITLLRLCSGQRNESEDHQKHEGLRVKSYLGFAIVCDVIKKARAFWGGVFLERRINRERRRWLFCFGFYEMILYWDWVRERERKEKSI